MENIFEKKNVQIYPSHLRVEPNDRLSKVLFALSDDDYLYFMEHSEPLNFVEIKNHQNFGKIVTPIKISKDSEEFTITEPLTQFDCAVLNVCISEWHAGNRHTTPAIICRGLSGKVGKIDAEPSKDQLAAILYSVAKLMRVQIDVDFSDVCKKLNYNNGLPKKILSTLLPCKYIEATTINGKDASVILFLDESPLLTSARLKNNQLLTYDVKLLDVPNRQNTPMNISLKNYVMRRVQEIKLHHMTPTITFADVFKKCRIEDADNKIKQRARDTIIKFFEHLKANSVLKSFELIKKGNAFYSITFFY